MKNKMILRILDHAFLPKLADLCGKSASVNFKVVGKLLAVEGDIKALTVELFRLVGEICEKLISCCAL